MNKSDIPACPHLSQVNIDVEKMDETSLSTKQGDETSFNIWRLVQRGLVYPSPYATFATFWQKEGAAPLTKELLSALVQAVLDEINGEYGEESNTTAIAGVGFGLWHRWCEEEDTPIPDSMHLDFPAEGTSHRSAIFDRSPGTYVDSEGDLWFHIKSDEKAHCDALFDFIEERLNQSGCIGKIIRQDAETKSTEEDKSGGKVLGCRFSENLNNPSNPITVQDQSIVGFEDVGHVGASYVFAQRFIINWEQIHNMTHEQIEDLVGRKVDDTLIPNLDTRSHIKSSRVPDDAGDTMQVLRLGLPFGQSRYLDNKDLAIKGSNIGEEEGIYFAGYAKSVRVLEAIVNNQIGDTDGFMHDRLLQNVQSDLGGLFYIPSMTDLGLEPHSFDSREDMNWSRFPGVDWSRLDRHFKARSQNGYMYYSHKDYLYALSTMSKEQSAKFDPPSTRVLRLLSNAFSRWQDNWYFNRKQPELKHLRVYLEEAYGKEEAERIMGLSVVERMGWTIRMSMGHVFVDKDYGFRRRRDKKGYLVNGADTYRIHPIELVVGGLPNIGLGQGRYVIDYTREDEQIGNFFMGLSYASGVGHVIPDFKRALDKGVGGLIADVEAKLAGEADEKKQQFYRGVILSLQGASEHCVAYAKLAGEMAEKMKPGQVAERENLLKIKARMEKLATEKPETMLEATQLILTLHSALHLTGEPTATGRLDQLLNPFYEHDVAAGILTGQGAQEIIDCFWIKVGEKVQLNRQFVEDHQPYGNLAMGGSSGPYPQGAANNQWIQQVTVGGTVANEDEEGQMAYNTVTKLCIRAAGRLPLNAPCLSLRVRKDMDKEYLEEAAKALLSGGAHPIFLNDDKLIPGLKRSGEGMGGQAVKDEVPELWNSEVSLSTARDYACDGCYETQFVGQNWFVIGGISTLDALECTINQGKTYSSAGPLFFRGQNASFTSKAPQDIESFDELLELYFKHFSWMFAKTINVTLLNYGRLSSVCPAPLLSALMDDCIEKGLDIYEGGARYNIIGPCFLGLSTTINSLYAIKKMVFDSQTAVTSLPELVDCLCCDWGHKMVEPFVNVLAGPARIAGYAERYKQLRKVAVALPKFGRGNEEVDALGRMVIGKIAQLAVEVGTKPVKPIADQMVKLAKDYGTEKHPFGGFQIQPGIGTFENYVEFGAGSGASADGRRLGQPLASDLSPSPTAPDLPLDMQEQPFSKVLEGYTGDDIDAMWDGAPADFNIDEDFSEEDLVNVLEQFAQGKGSNMLTITCAAPQTYADAKTHPEKYDILRVRMGGWSEFFTAMFPAHQDQHERRPFNTPDA